MDRRRLLDENGLDEVQDHLHSNGEDEEEENGVWDVYGNDEEERLHSHDVGLQAPGSRFMTGATMFAGFSTSPRLVRHQSASAEMARLLHTPPSSLSTSPFLHHLDSAKLGKRRAGQRGQVAALVNRRDELRRFVRAMAFGLINGAVMIPTMVGFASIIYKDPYYTDSEHNFLPQAIKLVFLSSSIHQVCFVIFSTLPFAVGQVQDAGLIFLSQMAASIVAAMTSGPEEVEPHAVMATTVVVLSLCTLVLGLLLMAAGKLKLARLIQYLPLPVIGGYLAFIGLFCGLSGLRLTTGTRVESILQIGKVFDAYHLKLLAPCVAGVAALFYISKKMKESQFALPLCLGAMPIGFYIVLLISGSSLEDARKGGWVAPAVETPVFYKVFELFDFQAVDLGAAFPRIIPTFLAMYAVVAFGSSLDVAAVQFEIGKPMDYDQELVTVGISNFVSGATGGYTGSYIFSQTIFTLRNQIGHRVCGLVVAAVEIALFLLPIDLLSILPRFFFGAVLLFVSVDLLLEWLIYSYFTIELREYVLVWLTFVAINIWGLEAGMAIGVLFSALQFVFSYSSKNKIELIANPTSHAVRSRFDRKILERYRDTIVAMRITGYQFFGTVIGTIVEVQKNVLVKKLFMSHGNTSEEASAQARALNIDSAQDRVSQHRENLFCGNNNLSVHSTGSASTAMQSGSHSPFSSMSSSSGRNNGVIRNRPFRTASDVGAAGAQRTFAALRQADNVRGVREAKPKKKLCRLYEEKSDVGAMTLEGEETRYVVLDLTNAEAIDATAARACFLTLLQSLNHHDIQLVFSGLSSDMERILAANDVLRRTPTLQEAFASSEEDLNGENDDVESGGSIVSASHHAFALSFGTLDDALQYCEEKILGAVIEETKSKRTGFFSTGLLRSIQDKYFTRVEVQDNKILFERGKSATCFYVLESGHVNRRDQSRSYSGGSIVGIDDFFLKTTYSYTAYAFSGTVLQCLTRLDFERMMSEEPEKAVHIQNALIVAMVK